jgi:hypothetical protein
MDQPNVPESTPPTLPTSTLALVSLISGIVGILFLPVVGGVAAIVTGNMARKETRAFPPTHWDGTRLAQLSHLVHRLLPDHLGSCPWRLVHKSIKIVLFRERTVPSPGAAILAPMRRMRFTF